jgi:hypothetical protein
VLWFAEVSLHSGFVLQHAEEQTVMIHICTQTAYVEAGNRG